MLPGTPSDEVADVLAAGRGDIDTLFVSMARRHPEGRDAEYLRWHTLDHRPEQHRLAGVRASLRLVSTPACRAARASNDERFDAIDHVMTYFFTDQSGLTGFNELSKALGGADRKLPLLPPVQRGVYAVQNKVAAPRIKTGADVLPWWPIAACTCCWSRTRQHRWSWSMSTVWPASGRWPRSMSTRAWQVHRRVSCSHTASSTTTRSPRRSGSRLSWRNGGNKPVSNRCWPRRFIPSYRMSGIAMCRKGFECASA